MTSNNLKKVLRVEDEPYQFYDELNIHGFLIKNCNKYMDFILNFYSNKLPNIELPTKQIFNSKTIKGDYRIMPCNIESLKVKCVKIIGTNEENLVIKDKISVGKAFLLDYYDNYIYAQFDVCILSSFRTAAISIVALVLLKEKKEIKNIGIIGSGRIGFYTAFILNKWLGIKDLNIYDTKQSQYDNFNKLTKHYLPEMKITISKTKNELLEKSNNLFICTDSKEEIVFEKTSYNLNFISSVGADANNLKELDHTLLNKYDIWIDFEQSKNLGDLKRWKDANINIVTNSLSEQKFKFAKNKNIVFISTGIALQDALICYFIDKGVKDNYV